MTSYDELPVTIAYSEVVKDEPRAAAPKKKKIRDSKYLKHRLAKEHPEIYAEVEAKRLSVRQAAAKAGLIRLPSRLDAIKREWKKISTVDKDEFTAWARAHDSGLMPLSAIANADGYLVPEVRKFARDWLLKTKSRPARIMEAIGCNPFDYRLSCAIDEKYPAPLKKELIEKLRPWLTKNGYC